MILSLLDVEVSLGFLLDPVFDLFLFLFSDCVFNLSQGIESLMVPPEATCFGCLLGFFVSLLILIKAYISWHLVDLYDQSPICQLLRFCDNEAYQPLASLRYCQL